MKLALALGVVLLIAATFRVLLDDLCGPCHFALKSPATYERKTQSQSETLTRHKS